MVNEENTVEQMVLDTLFGSMSENMVAEERAGRESSISEDRSTGGILHGI